MDSQLTKSIKWLGGSSFLTAFIQIIQLLLIANFLKAEQLGLASASLAFIFIIQVYAEMGVANAIIHFDSWSSEKLSVFFIVNLIFSLFLAIMIFIFSTNIADYLGDIRLDPLISVLSINMVILPLGRMYQAIAQKEILFEFISIIEVVTKVIGFISFSICILFEFGEWSLIISTLTSSIFSFLFYYGRNKDYFKFSLNFNFKLIHRELKFCFFYLGDTIVSSLNNQLDSIIVGKYFGMEKLGVYMLFKQICIKPYQIINPLAVKVALPLLSKYKNDFLHFKSTLIKFSTIFISILILIYLFIFMYGASFIGFFIHEDYEGYSGLLGFFAIWCLFRGLLSLNGIPVVAKGRSDYNFSFSIISLIISIVVLMHAKNYDLFYLIKAISLSSLFVFSMNIIFVNKKLTGLSFKEYFEMYIVLFFTTTLFISAIALGVNHIFVNILAVGVFFSCAFRVLKAFR